ncbi:MAG: hypothetical protein IT319_12345 [Anaerolineae bacterium]|nr:hypothetical protein [Anaerolineae bacterium]
MNTIVRFVRRVINDITNLRNVDAYIVGFIGIALILLDVLGSVELDAYLSVMTAALIVLLFRTTAPQKKEIDLDNVLLDRQSYTPLREFIQGAHVVWVYGPSAVNVLRESAAFKREVIDRGGEVRALLQDPAENSSMAILRQQLDPNNNLDHDIQGSLFTLAKMRDWGKVDYRLLPYNPGFSLLIIDPDGKDGRLVVEFFGYHNNLIDDRMHILIERRSSQYWFEYWAKQYLIMWDAARPVTETPAG